MRLHEAAAIMDARIHFPSTEGAPDAEAAGSLSIVDVAYDSRAISPGALFFCIPGAHSDGHRFAGSAVESGAAAVVCERILDLRAPQLIVQDSLAAMNRLASPFFRNPSSKMRIVGVSGTNGKTTTAYMLDAIFRASGDSSGLIGTVETRIGDAPPTPAGRTTPESIDLQRLLARMADAGVRRCAMEVTSIGLERGRVEGTRFSSVVFTNLSQDHLDYHPGMEAYYQAKKKLFSRDFSTRAAINVDDPHGRRLLDETELETLSYGTGPDSDLRAESIETRPDFTQFELRGPGAEALVKIPLPGKFNILNSLGAAGGALLADIEPGAISRGLENLRTVPGRMERIDEGQDFSVVVDYAHTPAALDVLIAALREASPRGRLLLVFGCGGDRDPGKRPQMGRAAGAADFAIATSDNPRGEDPAAILASVEEGLKRRPPRLGYLVREDRREAIREAISRARPSDTVILAGKGHETGQEVNGRRLLFDDREVAREALRARKRT